MTRSDLASALSPVIEVLELLSVGWHLGGSVASSMVGVPRTTLDVDLVADLRPEHVGPLLAGLGEEYYADEGMIREGIRSRGSFNLVHLETMLKVDVFVLKSRPWDREAFRRRLRDVLDEQADAPAVWIASAEDLILSKLEWFRAGGQVSDRQWQDVIGILRVQAGALDVAYLDHWAAELGVTDLVDRARREVAAG